MSVRVLLLLRLAACALAKPVARPLLRRREAGIDGGLWQMDPIFEQPPLARRLLQTSELEGRFLNDAIHSGKARGNTTCLTIAGHYTGGLANTVAMVNAAMLYASSFDVKFGMPKIRPSGHDTGKQFDDIFAGAAETCVGDVFAFEARCPDYKVWSKHFRTTPPLIRTVGGQCDIDQMTIGEGQMVQSHMCGCDVLFTVNSKRMGWSSHYETSFHVFRTAYWQGRYAAERGKPVEFPLSLTFHVSLGDVKSHAELGIHNDQYVEVSKYLGMIDALVENIDARCLNVLILSDGSADEDIELKQVEDRWKRVGAHSVKLFGGRTPTNQSLSMMTHADVNVGGISGFARLGAILSHAKVRFFIKEQEKSRFPLEFLLEATKATTSVRLDYDLRDYGTALGENLVLQSLARQCKETL